MTSARVYGPSVVDERTPDEDIIRSTYAAYDREGRGHLWDRSNPGYARLADGRDVAIMTLVAQSLSARPARFLDVGCGDGSLVGAVTSALAGRGGRRARPSARSRRGRPIGLPGGDVRRRLGGRAAVRRRVVRRGVGRSRCSRRSHRLSWRSRCGGDQARPPPGGWLVWYDLRYDNPSNPAVHGLSKGRLPRAVPGLGAAPFHPHAAATSRATLGRPDAGRLPAPPRGAAAALAPHRSPSMPS